MERRQFLALAGGGLLTIPFLSDGPKYPAAEDALASLATTIEHADLADPATASSLPTTIDAALTTSQRALHSGATKRARQLAGLQHTLDELVSILPGISPPPATPRIETRIDTIQSAVTYYQSLRDYLTTSAATRNSLLNAEFIIRDPTTDDAQALQYAPATDQLSAPRADLERATDQVTDHPSLRDRFLPDRSQVLSQTATLEAVYQTYTSVYHDYTTATNQVDAGTRALERGSRETARNTFSNAADTLSTTVDAELRTYSLDPAALSLGQYQTVLQTYRDALPPLQKACRTTPERGHLFTQGFDKLLNAREIIAPPR